MTSAAPNPSRKKTPWRPPLPTPHYRREPALTKKERDAIIAHLGHRDPRTRRRNRGLFALPDNHPLAPLLRPALDALAMMGTRRHDQNSALDILLRACLDAGATFWAWDREQWLDLLGRNSREFRPRVDAVVSQSVRMDLAAIAYLHGWFRDVRALGRFRRDALARRVFGQDIVHAAAKRVTEPLKQWGYHPGVPHLGCLCEALLQNESPHLEDLTTEGLERFRMQADIGKRSLFYQLSKSLAVIGILDEPLPIAPSTKPLKTYNIAEGVAATWSTWVERWHRTSTLDSRDDIRWHMYKLGRWLAAHYPKVDSPERWTRDTCVDYVAAVSRMRVGDYTVRKVKRARLGQPMSPRAIASELVAARTFFTDFQEWGWMPRRFDPNRSLALPRSLKAKIATKPRVIADSTWARLLAAGLHLEQDDLPRGGRDLVQEFTYPIEYARAAALVWLFAGLRSDEVSRLRVGCVRWQEPTSATSKDRVCLIDIPVNKTKADYTKPVDPQVGKAIEAWETIRPEQPQRIDRKTGESVDFLFMHRARQMRREFINESIIPILCRKAGIALDDVRGPITSHRARATIASQLFNAREPMTLFELQAWLGHGSPASTQHYVAITPTKLAKAYADAGYFERNMRAIEVLVDQDAVKQAAAGEPWRFYDLGHGLCAYEFFDQCAHRMACARCDFYRPGESDLVQLMTAKSNILRLKQELPLTDEEKAVVDGDIVAIEHLTKKLADRPTPSGQTPTELRCCGAGACSRRLTPDST
ncbi:MAG: tyrosine-type recombinase/integrase [Polyangiaceae bacterium]|nr:tyrosine-type recombinase/integrase [Polyangiaceae bacterium]